MVDNSIIVKYNLVFNIVREELNNLDPMGIQPGIVCPADEYDLEANMIVKKLSNAKDYETLAQEIRSIFNEMFDENFNIEVFYKCAKNILNRINKL